MRKFKAALLVMSLLVALVVQSPPASATVPAGDPENDLSLDRVHIVDPNRKPTQIVLTNNTDQFLRIDVSIVINGHLGKDQFRNHTLSMPPNETRMVGEVAQVLEHGREYWFHYRATAPGGDQFEMSYYSKVMGSTTHKRGTVKTIGFDTSKELSLSYPQRTDVSGTGRFITPANFNYKYYTSPQGAPRYHYTITPIDGTNPVPTPTPQPEPTSTPIPQPTATPIPQPTATPVPQPTATPVPQPTPTPQPEPTPTPAPAGEVPYAGKALNITTRNGSYLTSTWGSVSSAAWFPGANERFTFVEVSKSQKLYAIKHEATGRYLRFVPSWFGTSIRADSTQINPFAMFRVTDLGNDQVAIRAANGRYLSATFGGGFGVYPSGYSIRSWERFTLN